MYNVLILYQGLGAGLVVVFQNIAQGILITTKSYLLRTSILSFFLLLLPVGKLILIKLGLLGLSPAILSRAGHQGGGPGLGDSPYDTPVLQTVQGFIESCLWEIYLSIETVFDTSEFDDYLYT